MGKTIAIIPARSGSKGVPNKNIALVNGKPLIAYTIDQAIKSNVFEEIFVSTDSEEYALIARTYGASVPFLRPIELATDNSHANEYIKDTLIQYKNIGEAYDYFMILQPTSPLRTVQDIQNAMKLLNQENVKSVVSICELDHSPELINILPKNHSLENFINKTNNKNRQDLKKIYRINGAIYGCECSEFLKHMNFYNKYSKAYIMSKENSLDIDTPLDLEFAKFIIQQKALNFLN